MTTFWRMPRDSSPGSEPFLAGQLQLVDQRAAPGVEIGNGVETRHQPQVLFDGQVLEEMRLVGHERQPPLGLERRRGQVMSVDAMRPGGRLQDAGQASAGWWSYLRRWGR